MSDQTQQAAEPLSKREREVASAYAKGGSYKEIARDLRISPGTVRTHLSTIYRKLGVSTKVALAVALTPIPMTATPDEAEFPQRPERPSIAVLAFENLSGDPEQTYFSDGLSDDIINVLSRISWLFVIARNTTFTYKDRAVDVRRIAQELGVRYVLEGGLRRSGDRLRITAQLIDGDTGGPVWSERYDRQIEDLFDLQDDITSCVVSAIQLEVRKEETPIERQHRPVLTIWELTMRAWRLIYDFKEESFDLARGLLEQALTLDPDSAEAHLMLSLVYRHEIDFAPVEDRHASMEKAYTLAKRAIELDHRNEFGYWALGISSWPLGRQEDAVAALERAIELNPNFSLARGSLGTALNFVGRCDEAIEHQLIAIRSNPRDRSNFYRYIGVAFSHYLEARYDDAIDWANRAARLMPNVFYAYSILAVSYEALGDRDRARAAITDGLAAEPGVTLARLRHLELQDSQASETFRSRLIAAGMPSGS